MIEAIGERTIEKLRQEGYKECMTDGQTEFSMERVICYAESIRIFNPATDIKLIASETGGLFKLLALKTERGGGN